ncbi:hypothetical protein KSZ_66100 [Dictyobacter formicarum]|uniref:Uncharacterized protein n=1 Tax=Dictyobacter formicarum TaxID=2778368 RepID=A0ABQ3VQR2_9CHLR|nr:hypothetical protein KSZ_66100 [Dictyobacter formicarum]
MSVRNVVDLIDRVPDEKISHLGKTKMVSSGLDISRGIKRGTGLQHVTRLEAMQLYPCHPELGMRR